MQTMAFSDKLDQLLPELWIVIDDSSFDLWYLIEQFLQPEGRSYLGKNRGKLIRPPIKLPSSSTLSVIRTYPLSPHASPGLPILLLSLPVGANVLPLGRFPPVDLSKTSLGHLQIDVVSINKNLPQYPTIPVGTIRFHIDRTVQGKFGQETC